MWYPYALNCKEAFAMAINSVGMNPSIFSSSNFQSAAPAKSTYPSESQGALAKLLEAKAPEIGVNNAPETSMFGSKGDALGVISERIRELVQQSLDVQPSQDSQALYQSDGSALSQSLEASMAVGMYVDMYA
jgi:hypothetical protein